MNIPLFADPTLLTPDDYQTLFEGLRKLSDILTDDEIRLFILALESCVQHFGMLPEEKMSRFLRASIAGIEKYQGSQILGAIETIQGFYKEIYAQQQSQ